MITVDADEVTPNTEYTCNITGRIPTFTGVQLGELSICITRVFFLLIWGWGLIKLDTQVCGTEF